jgi:5-methylthioribose kinase
MKYHTNAEHFSQLFPQAFFVDARNPNELSNYLSDTGFLLNNEHVMRLEKAGNGCMNLVLRAYTESRSFIVKQARPWMENNPGIEAPAERIVEEAGYYQLIAGECALKKYHPDFLYFDCESFLMVLEDIGNVSDFTHIYQKKVQLSTTDAIDLVNYLVLLHNNFSTAAVYERIFNRDMRKMNFENIFVSPFRHHEGLGLNSIQPGFSEIAEPYLKDKVLIDNIKYLGRLYESDGDYLVHGDFYPGSWLKTSTGIKIIDPECCFFGPAEFDLAVFLAHLVISQQPEIIFKTVIAEYADNADFSRRLTVNYAGAEILRRLLSPVQLPLYLTLRERRDLMAEARKMLVAEQSSQLWSLIKN